MLKALRRKYPGLFAVKTLVLWISALWKPIEFVLNWIGLADTVRAAMDSQHWFSQLLFWPPLGLVISVVGIAGLFFVIWRDRRHWTGDQVSRGATRPAAGVLPPDLMKRLAELEEEGIKTLLPAGIGDSGWKHPETFPQTGGLWKRNLLEVFRQAGVLDKALVSFEALPVDWDKKFVTEGLACIRSLRERGQRGVVPDRPIAAPAVIGRTDWRRLSDEFKAVPSDVSAAWWTEQGGKELWRLAGDPTDVLNCTALCRHAGTMLLKSLKVASGLSDEVKKQHDPVDRWLKFVQERGGARIEDVGYGESRSQFQPDGPHSVYFWGDMKGVGPASVRACIECGTLEL